MATENIEFKVKIDGVEEEIKSLKDLKQAIKAATDEQLRAAEKFGIGSKEYTEASKKVSALKDKVDDLRDSTKSLQGSGIERASAGFNQLGEGLRNLDFDKVKVGLTAMKSALAATGIGLIVALVSTLAEKFDIFGKITDVVTNIVYKFTDAIGLTNKALEEATKKSVESISKQNDEITKRYDNEIKLAKAAGKDTSDLEIDKLKAVEDGISKQLDVLEKKKNTQAGLNDEEQKQYSDLQQKKLDSVADRISKELEIERLKSQNLANLEEKLRVGSLSAREKEIDTIKKQQQELINELNKNHEVRLGNELNDTIRYNEDVKRINELTQKQINEVNAKYYKEDSEKRYKKIVEDLNKELELNNYKNKSFSEQLRAEQEAQTELDNQTLQTKLANETTLTDFNLKTNEQLRNEYRQRQWEEIGNDYNKQIQLAQQTNQALQGLSDLYFTLKTKNLKKGSKEEEEYARKQFNINKALSIANTVVSGAQGIVNGLTAPYPQNIVLPIVAGITTAASVAKIASTQFTGSGSSGSAATAPSVPIPAPPTAPTPTEGRRSTTFDESGSTSGTETFRTMQPTITVKAQVIESDMTEAQKRVNKFDKQTTF